jgi:hypothetical protein
LVGCCRALVRLGHTGDCIGRGAWNERTGLEMLGGAGADERKEWVRRVR